jgi:predicted pyridoxine 5'-phosphate oxidase superfamily flavin-nucleotide-binding protein
MMHDAIDDGDRAFIEARDMFFLATVDADGAPQSSYKGGEPGFVRVLDEQTIAFPSFDGNGMYLSLGNIAQTSRVGLLFIDFEGQKRLRLNGIASIDPDDPLLGEYPRAQCIVRVHATEVFPNCPRYIHKLQLVEHSRFTPRADCEPPVPDWKRREWARDVLPAGDPAND